MAEKFDLQERIDELDRQALALELAIEVIKEQILLTLQEKSECIHDMKLEAKRRGKKIGFVNQKEDETT